MKYEAWWTLRAFRDLQGFDRRVADRITRKVAWYCAQSNPMKFAKQLGGRFKEVHRFRVGDYRVLFEIIDGAVRILMILRVKYRRDVY